MSRESAGAAAPPAGAAAPPSSNASAGNAVSAEPAGDVVVTTGKAKGATLRKIAAVPRKIIYTAEVSLMVADFARAQSRLVALVQTQGGYVAETNISGSAGAARQGTWKVRVPAETYEGFLTGVAKLGEVQTIRSDSQDVSEEYYDIEARLANKRVEEQRMLRHLRESTATLQEILTMEREISRVRGEIEQMRGRLNVIANLTSLTTITISMSEVQKYVPPKSLPKPEPPAFNAQVADTFSASLGALINVGKNIILLVVAFLPWLLALLIVTLPLWLIMRRYQKLTPATHYPASYPQAPPAPQPSDNQPPGPRL